MIGKWTAQPFKGIESWQWKLTNREVTLVMTSPIRFLTEAGAHNAADNEVNELHQAVLEK